MSFTLLCFGVILMVKAAYICLTDSTGTLFSGIFALLHRCAPIHYIQSILKILLSVLLGVYPVLMKTEDFSCITNMCM